MWFQTFTLSLGLLLVFEGGQYAEAGPELEMSFENSSCSSEDPKGLVRMLTCNLSKNSKRRSFNLELLLAHEVKQFKFDILFVLPCNNAEDFVLLNLTNLNGCDLLSSKNQVTLVQLGRTNLDSYGNIPKKCPLKANVLYYIRGLRFNMKLLPALSFETDMNVWFDLSVNGNAIIRGFMKSHVGMKNGRKMPF